MPFVVSLLILVLLGAPGVRLLMAAAREHRAPELWCGLFFSSVAVGMAGRVFAVSFRFSDPDGVRLIDGASHAFIGLGLTALVVFILRVFHPEGRGARAAGALLVAAGLAVTVYAIHERFTIGEQPTTVILANLTRLLPLVWAFFESARYWRNMKRREALGLADPIVRNRFGLWTLWTGGVTIVPIVALSLRTFVYLTYGTEGLENGAIEAILPTMMNVVRVVMLSTIPFTIAALWLSFFPPQAYLARVERKSAAASA